jgi:ABC-type multidrug transport system permease subunit
MALISTCIFWQINGIDRKSRYNMAGGTFFLCINNTMMPLMGTLGLFQNERPVFLREQANNMYSIFIYFLTKTMTEQPINLMAPFMNCLIVYYAMGFDHTFDNFIIFYLTIYFLIQANLAFGYVLSSIFHDYAVANMAAPAIMMPLILFSGFYSNYETQPEWLKTASYLSPVKYGFEALLRNEFEDNTTGDDFDIIEMLGFNVGKWNCILVLIGIGIFLRLVAYIALSQLVSKFQ